MILLITCLSAATEYKKVLQRGTGEQVQLVSALSDAAGFLRQNDYSAVVIDQDLARSEAEVEASLLQNCGTAFPLYINFSISNPERVLAELRSAIRRRQAERLAALRMASSDLRNELAGAVTGILLSSELAMSVPELPRAAQVKIKFVHDLAQGIRRQLEAS